MAHRPPSVAAVYVEEFTRLAAEHGVGEGESRSARERAARRWLSADQFDAFIDVM